MHEIATIPQGEFAPKKQSSKWKEKGKKRKSFDERSEGEAQ